MATEDPTATAGECPRCLKPAAYCVCAEIEPVKNRVFVLILQHPQEQDKLLGTARLTALHLENAALKIGLSWPSLAAALGRPAEPRRWAVLYLGSAKPAELAPGLGALVLDRKSAPLPNQGAALTGIEGIVLLDGTWSQAKALWWRNPWLLKLRRVVLAPVTPSRYGTLRREPRADSLSTLEATALLLARLEKRPEIAATLNAGIDRLLARAQRSGGQGAGKPASRDRRRNRGGGHR